MNQTINATLQIWLTWIFTKAIGICGAGLAAIGITTSGDTPQLMAGVALTSLHLLLSWWNTRRALKVVPTSPQTLTAWPLHTGCAAAGLIMLGVTLSACGTSGSAASASSASSNTPAGNATTSTLVEAALPVIRLGASVATGAVLDFGVKQSATRTRLANEMYSAANAVYSLSGGTFPTVTQFQSSILAFGGSQTDASYAQFAGAISSLYGAWYPKLATGGAKTAADFTMAIAGGIEDATQAYVTTPATGLASAHS